MYKMDSNLDNLLNDIHFYNPNIGIPIYSNINISDINIINYINSILYHNDKLFYDETIVESIKDCGDHHLHVVSDENFEDGDWVRESDGGVLKYKYQLDRFSPNSFKKIIASTDELLTCNGVKREGESCTYNNGCKYPSCRIACISKDFIEEFIKFYNEGTTISKVLIEMEVDKVCKDRNGCAKMNVAEFEI